MQRNKKIDIYNLFEKIFIFQSNKNKYKILF